MEDFSYMGHTARLQDVLFWYEHTVVRKKKPSAKQHNQLISVPFLCLPSASILISALPSLKTRFTVHSCSTHYLPWEADFIPEIIDFQHVFSDEYSSVLSLNTSFKCSSASYLQVSHFTFSWMIAKSLRLSLVIWQAIDIVSSTALKVWRLACPSSQVKPRDYDQQWGCTVLWVLLTLNSIHSSIRVTIKLAALTTIWMTITDVQNAMYCHNIDSFIAFTKFLNVHCCLSCPHSLLHAVIFYRWNIGIPDTENKSDSVSWRMFTVCSLSLEYGTSLVSPPN